MKYLLLLSLILLPAAAHAADFVPLTSLPGLDNLSTAGTGSLADFFNQLYRLCIGAAAVIAVFQIIRAGFASVMQEGSVIEKSKVREMITSAIFGLVLVLSPAIVFGIIDPRILNLSLDFQGLRVDDSSFGVSNGNDESLTEEERTDISNEIAEAARSCGMTWTAEQSRCVTDNMSNGEAAIRACVPPMTAEQEACLTRESGRRITNINNDQDSNLHTYHTDPNSYINLAIGHTSDASCRSLLGNTYTSAESCQQALPEFQARIQGFGGGWTMLFSCQHVASNGNYSVTGENICADQPNLP